MSLFMSHGSVGFSMCGFSNTKPVLLFPIPHPQFVPIPFEIGSNAVLIKLLQALAASSEYENGLAPIIHACPVSYSSLKRHVDWLVSGTINFRRSQYQHINIIRAFSRSAN